MKRVNLELPDDLLVRVDAAAGDVPRNRWIRRVVEQALGEPDSGVAVGRNPAPAERPVRSSSRAKRNVKPIPKRAR